MDIEQAIVLQRLADETAEQAEAIRQSVLALSSGAQAPAITAEMRRFPRRERQRRREQTALRRLCVLVLRRLLQAGSPQSEGLSLQLARGDSVKLQGGSEAGPYLAEELHLQHGLVGAVELEHLRCALEDPRA